MEEGRWEGALPPDSMTLSGVTPVGEGAQAVAQAPEEEGDETVHAAASGADVGVLVATNEFGHTGAESELDFAMTRSGRGPGGADVPVELVGDRACANFALVWGYDLPDLAGGLAELRQTHGENDDLVGCDVAEGVSRILSVSDLEQDCHPAVAAGQRTQRADLQMDGRDIEAGDYEQGLENTEAAAGEGVQYEDRVD